MKKLYTLSLFAFFFCQNPPGFGQFFEPLNGPNGIHTNDLAVSPNGTAYMTSEKGIFRSEDDGNSWEKIMDGIPDNFFTFRNIIAAPNEDVFAITGNKIGWLPSGENTWTLKSVPNINGSTSMSINPYGNIYVANYTWGIYRAESGTDDFQFIFDPVEPIKAVKTFGNDKNYLLTENSSGIRLFRFTDDGSQLDVLGPPVTVNKSFSDLDLVSDSILLLSTAEGLFVSTDWGTFWEYRDFDNDGEREHIYSAHTDAEDNLYFLTVEGVFYSEDAGETFELLSGGPFNYPPFNFLFSDMAFSGQNHIYINSRDNFFSHSGDGGFSWDRLDRKFQYPFVKEINSDFEKNLFALTTSIDGFEKSEDDGDTWEALNVNGKIVNAIDFHSNGDWFAIVDEGGDSTSVHRSWDKGQTWQNVTPSNQPNRYSKVAAILNGDVYLFNQGDILISDDLGETWEKKEFDAITSHFPPQIHPNGNIYIATTTGTYVSEDGGDSWFVIQEDFINSGAIQISDLGKIYMAGFTAVSDPGFIASILVSDMNGENFDFMPFLPINTFSNLFIIPACGEVLAMTDGFGFFMTVDGGNSWINIGFGLNPANEPNRIYMDEESYFYLGLSADVIQRSKTPLCEFVNGKNVLAGDFEVKISPNPMSDFALIEIGNKSKKEFSLRIFDSTGQEVRYEKRVTNNHPIQKGNLRPGLYFYSVERESQILKSGKLMIK